MGMVYNVIDADGHVCEPLDLWELYIDPKFRSRAPRVMRDTDGRERFSVDGKMVGSPDGSVRAGAIGKTREEIKKMIYTDGRRGGFDPHERIKDLDLEGIDAAVLYPSMGLFSGVIEDPDFSAAVCRAYNRWIVDYCQPYPERLIPAAMLPMQSPDAAVAEMRFARNTLGVRTGFLRPNPYNGRLLSDRAYEPVWQEAAALDMAIGFHEGTGGMQSVGVDRSFDYASKHIMSHTMEMMAAALNIIWGGVCERHPTVRFAFLECGGGWMAPWLDRMDRHFDSKSETPSANTLTMRPSDYFRRQCWISFEPVENTIESSARQLGENKLLWATDYPHYDGFLGAPQMIKGKLPAALHRPVLAQGAIDFYKL